MPLEKILDLKMPEELIDDKRGAIWSTDTLLATFALDRGESHSTPLEGHCIHADQRQYDAGFLTAKAARPDVYRSGSMLIRAFYSSQIAWSFRPTTEEVPQVRQEGIWLPDFQAGRGRDIAAAPAANVVRIVPETTDAGETTGFEGSTEDSRSESENESDEEDEEEQEEEESEEAVTTTKPSQSAFALLAVDDGGSDETSE